MMKQHGNRAAPLLPRNADRRFAAVSIVERATDIRVASVRDAAPERRLKCRTARTAT